jgi:hypothetical protein
MTTRAAERGMTLTEVTIVFVLASLVMTGLITFYLNAQAIWMDGSAQAISQREATLVIEAISAHARLADSSVVTPGAPYVRIDLRMPDAYPVSSYSYWVDSDNRMHESFVSGGVTTDRGAMLMSEVMCFSAHAEPGLLHVDSLRVKSASGSQITLATAAAFQNR